MNRNYRTAKTDTRLTTPYKTGKNPTHSPLGTTDLQIKRGCPPSRRDQEQFPPPIYLCCTVLPVLPGSNEKLVNS